MARDQKYDVLFEPIQIGPKTMKNRFYQVPHCNGAGSERPGTQAAFRGMKAEGGWGGICTEACSIDHQADTSPSVLASLWDEGDVINLRHMCDTLHKWGALAGVELWHMGAATANLETRAAPSSPTQSTSDWSIATYSHEADEYEIAELQDRYVEAAKRAVQAGFDIVYVYGSHGVLPVQFLSRFHNNRTDKYGGSFENRARFWMETIEKVKHGINDDAALCVRISVDQVMGPDGVQAQDDGIKFVKLATERGLVDLWDLNISTFAEWGEDAGPSRFYKSNHQAPFTRGFKEAANVPVINVGRFTSPDDMAQVINSGQADIIGAARPSIADPFLPRKIDEGRTDDIRECIGCNICYTGDGLGVPIRCTQNPTMGEEWRRGWHPEFIAKKGSESSVLVVGAGPAGLEATRALGQRGYRVTLAEATRELGGRVTRESKLPGLSEWQRVRDYRLQQIDVMPNVEVFRESELSVDEVLAVEADHIVFATGATWRADGFGRSHLHPLTTLSPDARILTPDDVMAGHLPDGPTVIFDDDSFYMGGVIAEQVRRANVPVSVVTPENVVSAWCEYTSEQYQVQKHLLELGVEIKTAHSLLAYDGQAVTISCTHTGRQQSIKADVLIMVTARRPRDELYQDLNRRMESGVHTPFRSVRRIGDCEAPAIIAAAVHSGHRYARELDTEPDPDVPLRLE